MVRHVITVVHGTWGRGLLFPSGDASWTVDNAPFCSALRDTLGTATVIRRYRWSGRNSHTARLRAADGLRTCLQRALSDYPDAAHTVVAHSHGGNVALVALDDENLRTRIAGVACLATPFITARRRDIGPDFVTTFVPALMVLVAGIAWIVHSRTPDSWPDLARGAIDVVTGIFLLAASIPLLKLAQAWAERLRRTLTPVLPSRDRLLIVRSPADEASGVISVFQIISELTVRLFLVAEALYTRLRAVAAKLARHKTALLAVSTIGAFVVFPGALFEYMKLIAPNEPGTFAIAVFLFFSGVLVTPFLVLLHLVDEDALTFMFLLLKSALLWPVIAIMSAVLLLPFGWQVAVANMFLDVTTEATPIGFWELHVVEPSTSRDLHDSIPHLTHMVYESREAHTLIAAWIAARTSQHRA